MRSVSIVIPTLNEEKSIRQTIESIPKDKLKSMGYKVQILIVDSSTDKTALVAKTCGADVIKETKKGYGAACKAGFNDASGDIIVTSDGDGTYPLQDIPNLLGVLEEGNYDYVNTNRFARMEQGAMSFRNKFGNFVLTFFTDLLFNLRMKDSQSGFCAFKKDTLSKIKLDYANQVMCQELKIEICHFMRGKWKEIPIDYYKRVGSPPKQSGWKGGFACLKHLFVKRIKR